MSHTYLCCQSYSRVRDFDTLLSLIKHHFDQKQLNRKCENQNLRGEFMYLEIGLEKIEFGVAYPESDESGWTKLETR